MRGLIGSTKPTRGASRGRGSRSSRCLRGSGRVRASRGRSGSVVRRGASSGRGRWSSAAVLSAAILDPELAEDLFGLGWGLGGAAVGGGAFVGGFAEALEGLFAEGAGFAVAAGSSAGDAGC